jgi:hypothetical protein
MPPGPRAARFPSVADGGDAHRMAFEKSAEQITDLSIVVDHENMWG